MAYLDLEIKGGDAKLKELSEQVVEFAVLALKLDRFNLEINLKLKNLKGVEGWCIWEDTNIRPREFTIEVRKNQTKANFITTILHEMVHVKQYVRNEMQERFQGEHRVLWKGKNFSDKDYLDQPWEKEAYKLQEVLYKKYLKEYNK